MGSPSSVSAAPATAAMPGRLLWGNRSGRSSSAKAYSSFSSRGKQRHSPKWSAAGPSGSGTWTRLRGSPNSATLPVATSKLATIMVSVRRPVRVLAGEDRGHQVVGLQVVEGGGGVRGRGQAEDHDQPHGRAAAPAAR